MNFLDFRYALRGLRKTPGLTAVVVLILGVAVGATVVSFSVVKSVLLDPLPFAEPSRLVRLWETNQNLGLAQEPPSPANLLDWRDSAKAFTGIAAYWQDTDILESEAGARELPVVKVTEDFFRVLQVPAALGRLPTDQEFFSEERVVVVSSRFFQTALGGDPSALEKNLLLGDEQWRVVGVMPADFRFPSAEAELWRPWSLMRQYAHVGGVPRDARWLDIVARVAPEFNLATAESDLASVAAQLIRDYPRDNQGWGVKVTSLKEELIRGSQQTLWVLFGAIGLVLLIACANLSSLLQVRSLSRQHETAIRQAMGASKRDLLRLSLAEGLSLGGLGGALGLILAYLGLGTLLAYQPGDLPRVDEITMDWGVFLFGLLVSLAAGLAFGLIPLLRRSNGHVVQQLTAGGGRSSTAGVATQRLRSAFTLSEVVLAMVLLVGAGLLVKSFVNLRAVDPGFQSKGLLSFSVRLGNRYVPKLPDIPAIRYFENLRQRLEALPGVKSAAAATVLPMTEVGTDFTRPYWRPGRKPPDGEIPKVGIRMATPGFFETMGMKLRGRGFTEEDRMEALPVVVFNETLARKSFGAEDPLNRELVVDYLGRQTAYQVVGVVQDLKSYGLRSEPVEELYLPHAQVPYLKMNVVVRTSGDPVALAGLVRNTLRDIDPGQPAFNMKTMESRVTDSVSRDRFATGLLSFLALVALVLAALGIYGLEAHGVRQRTQEFGVRLALGASRQSIVTSVIKGSLRLVLAGLAVGVVLALFVSRWLSALLFGISSTDPTIYALVALVLALTAVVAGWLPARRATRIDIVRALTN